MNYIERVRGFWRSREEHSFSTTEVALYFYLLEVCNSCLWKNLFKRNNAKIEADLGISFKTISTARNKLQQRGLIAFKTRNGCPNVEYTLAIFPKVRDEVRTVKDKQNLNQTKRESAHPPLRSVSEVSNNADKPHEPPTTQATQPFVSPTMQEVEAYCSERGNGISAQKFVSYYQSNGVGKTVMYKYALPAVLLKEARKVEAYYNYYDLNTHTEEILEKKSIAIDDIGNEEQAIIYGNKRWVLPEVVDNAEKRNNLIILSTNLNAQELMKKYDARTLDRIVAITHRVKIEHKSFRE
ncbi:MAG: hypothetical protein LBG19_13415 [Prevotellaceae bacterium]|jgi:hypothetical protein|nr:hypothetical protein [Prevotellaceae bacterium]